MDKVLKVVTRWMKESGSREFTTPIISKVPPALRHMKPFIPHGTDMRVWLYPVALWTERGEVPQEVLESYMTPGDRTDANQKWYLAWTLGKQVKGQVYVYPSKAEAVHRMLQIAQSSREALDRKTQIREKAKNFKTDLFFGDILVWSGGYNRTYNMFYQVTEVLSDKQVMIRPIGKKILEGGSIGGWKVEPIPDSFDGLEFKATVLPGNKVRVKKDEIASKWSGRPMHENDD